MIELLRLLTFCGAELCNCYSHNLLLIKLRILGSGIKTHLMDNLDSHIYSFNKYYKVYYTLPIRPYQELEQSTEKITFKKILPCITYNSKYVQSPRQLTFIFNKLLLILGISMFLHLYNYNIF